MNTTVATILGTVALVTAVFFGGVSYGKSQEKAANLEDRQKMQGQLNVMKVLRMRDQRQSRSTIDTMRSELKRISAIKKDEIQNELKNNESFRTQYEMVLDTTAVEFIYDRVPGANANNTGM